MNRPPDPPAEAKAIFNHGRHRWMGMVSRDPALNSTAVRVAVRLWDRYNVKFGGAWPSVDTLADEIAMNRTTVMHALRMLEDHGWLVVNRRGRGRSNFYRIAFGNFAVDDTDSTDNGVVAPTPPTSRTAAQN